MRPCVSEPHDGRKPRAVQGRFGGTEGSGCATGASPGRAGGAGGGSSGGDGQGPVGPHDETHGCASRCQGRTHDALNGSTHRQRLAAPRSLRVANSPVSAAKTPYCSERRSLRLDLHVHRRKSGGKRRAACLWPLACKVCVEQLPLGEFWASTFVKASISGHFA